MAKNNEFAIEKMNEAKDLVINAIVETMDLYGVTTAAGRLYATMQFEDQMNLDEMRDELGMSTSVRKLQGIDMMKKKFQRGSRKHVYVAEKIISIHLYLISVICGTVKPK